MKHITRFGLALLLAVLLLPAMAALAQSGGPPRQPGGYDLSWWTVDGGGATKAGANGYTLGGTAGQPDAAVWSGGSYTLAGGFWGGALVEYHLYLPLVMRSS